jgi:hypothetical protein
MSGAAQGSGSTAKQGEDEKKAQGEPQKEQQAQQPALLEEDDEFEDFPIEGKYCSFRRCGSTHPDSNVMQIGQKKRAKYLEAMHTYGRRAGTMTIRTRIFRNS